MKVTGAAAVPLGDAVLTITVDGRVREHFIRILGPGKHTGWLAVGRRAAPTRVD